MLTFIITAAQLKFGVIVMAEIMEGGKTNDNGINLLLLEGGGVKGDIEVVILNNIEQLTGKPTCELFPVRGGTSVGGLLLFCLEYLILMILINHYLLCKRL